MDFAVNFYFTCRNTDSLVSPFLADIFDDPTKREINDLPAFVHVQWNFRFSRCGAFYTLSEGNGSSNDQLGNGSQGRQKGRRAQAEIMTAEERTARASAAGKKSAEIRSKKAAARRGGEKGIDHG
jgi:hypothetical protein